MTIRQDGPFLVVQRERFVDTVLTADPEPGEQDYLRQIELLARDVVHAAQDPASATALQEAVDDLARTLRHRHFDGDGCVDDGRPVLHLGGAALLTPGTTAGRNDNYRAGCSRLGVAERPDGWALWYTWDDQQRAHTMVTTALETTRELLEQWSQGRDVHPAQPWRAQIAAVVRGWVGPVTLSPSHAARTGLGGR